MKGDLVMCDGVLRKSDELRISPFDLGWTVGDGVFETLLVREGEVFAFSRHFVRLQNSAALLGMAVPEMDELRAQTSELLQASGIQRGRLRVTLSAGVPETGFSQKAENQRVVITLVEIGAREVTPARVLLSETRKFSEAISSRAKTLSYGENVWALREGQARGADEVLLANERGEICEGAMANVFVWKDGGWKTPPLASGCLPGVTRALLSEILALDEAIVEEVLSPADLQEVGEMVLTSSLRGVWPVARLGGRDLCMEEGKKLAARYEALLRATSDP